MRKKEKGRKEEKRKKKGDGRKKSMEIKNLTCINCPMGCQLTVEMEGNEVIRVNGNTCRRGSIYAHKEMTNPTRIVTSTVRVAHGSIAMVSVKTKEDIPKDKIFACIEALKHVKAEAPIRIGDVIVSNIADTGVDVVATKHVERIG